jgi:GNAT superfamily N-acetyltransferase
MEDVRPLKARIYAMLRDCNYEEHRQVLELLKKLKPQEATRTRTSAEKPAATTSPKPTLNIEIDYLCGKWMHYVGQVAQWTYDTHFKGKRPENYEKVLASTKVCYAAMLPIRLVAVSGADLLGSISIIKHEHEGRTVPLVTFMCVSPKHKAMGIEQKMIGQAIRVLKGLGYKDAYIKADKQFFPTDITFEAVKTIPGVFYHQIPSRVVTY